MFYFHSDVETISNSTPLLGWNSSSLLCLKMAIRSLCRWILRTSNRQTSCRTSAEGNSGAFAISTCLPRMRTIVWEYTCRLISLFRRSMDDAVDVLRTIIAECSKSGIVVLQFFKSCFMSTSSSPDRIEKVGNCQRCCTYAVILRDLPRKYLCECNFA